MRWALPLRILTNYGLWALQRSTKLVFSLFYSVTLHDALIPAGELIHNSHDIFISKVLANVPRKLGCWWPRRWDGTILQLSSRCGKDKVSILLDGSIRLGIGKLTIILRTELLILCLRPEFSSWRIHDLLTISLITRSFTPSYQASDWCRHQICEGCRYNTCSRPQY
jgi:hypothetical protein